MVVQWVTVVVVALSAKVPAAVVTAQKLVIKCTVDRDVCKETEHSLYGPHSDICALAKLTK